MVLDTRLLDIITQSIYEVCNWTYIIVFNFFSFSDIDGGYDGLLSSLFPLFLVTIIISLIFVVIKILKKFIWGF